MYDQRGIGAVDEPLQAGQKPGTIYIEAIDTWVDAKSWTDTVIYDTEQVVTPFAAGNQLIFFRNLTFPNGVRKDARYTNMRTASQLPAGWYAKVYAMSLRVLQQETGAGTGLFTTAEDVSRISVEAVGTFRTGNQKEERALPWLMWPSPHGLTGSIFRTGPGFSTWSHLNNGLASAAAMEHLTFAIELTNELTFEGIFTAPGGLTLDNNTMVMMELHAIQSIPLR